MAEKKPGPVKSPIIDAKARESRAAPSGEAPRAAEPAQPDTPAPAASESPATAKPDSATAGPRAATAKKPEPGPSARPAPAAGAPSDTAPASTKTAPLPLAPLAVAAGAGALVGLALAYGLASFGLWPDGGRDADAALAALDARTGRIETALGVQDGVVAEAAGRIDAVEAALTARITELADAAPGTEGLAAQADLDALGEETAALAARIEAVAAGASGEEADLIAQMAQRLETLAARLDALEPQVEDALPALAEARSRIDDLDARIVDQPALDTVSAERDRMAQLPGALDRLARAIAAGAPFAVPLAELETLSPGLAVDDEARAIAAMGVATPAALLSGFREAIPVLLAARPQDPDANWAKSLLDQAGAALALRPTEGDSPQARVGQIEAALEAGDLVAAEQGLAQLPAPMRAAASGFAEALSRTLAAERLLAAARQTGAEAAQ
ncbi:COG4223 family protein [Pelagibacterium lacus]|uniref:Uncharacterized protein n=1 Tax=Pelagibacterium lacus TaxID=2282655 RepID=A0A369WC39_9HYPH|nr:hypothetical protein [Pelagibacterium lacus]RDE09681.1 hypothetical protein DVH29_05865 [Pelagibacterium lacus]